MDRDLSRLLRCGTTASRRRTPTGSRVTSIPATNAAPAVGRTLVVRTPTVVVLPAPLGPSRPKTSPGATWKLIPSTATVGFLGYRFTRFSTAAAGPLESFTVTTV